MAAIPVENSPGAPATESVEDRLRRFETRWQADTAFLSDADRIIRHPAFRAIVDLGQDVVPVLLRDLETKPSLWVWALPEITGENPVPPADSGNIRKMTTAWLEWGRGKSLR
jgi:hypothetical protein